MQTDLLTLDFTGVAGHEASLAQLGLEAFVVLDQGAGDAEADRTGLAGDAAAGDGDLDVELVGALGQFERLAHDHARGLATEELVQGLAVDFDRTAALAQEHAGGGGLATAGAVILLNRHVDLLLFKSPHNDVRALARDSHYSSSACGCWAVCGCSAPP